MARVKSTTSDDLTLQMALIGYELERQKIDDKIKEIRARLGDKKVQLPSAAVGSEPAAPRKRNLSPAARKRIAMAQKRRWAEHRKQKAQGGKPEKGSKAEPKA
jgi:hypothetical protein